MRITDPYISARVAESTPDECWLWRGPVNEHGYGRFRRNGERAVYAHRAVWALVHGPIPSGMIVRHKCDNPPCCNPAHLEIGSHQDNSNDAVLRDRVAFGERRPQARLTAEDVHEIRRRLSQGQQQADIAVTFGVARSTIGHIAQGATWRRVRESA